ncbi:GlxA family transcriptional regulator [Methylobacterium sp. J-092]|uniref:GlxA family transcriptional regulator n=1 Tax=Methylobacterium sp. J-092 TaxID=2836667 RepID=UPI001FB95E8F|nr:GlxA family transcriptional regulator [Methylobacterium sp. J-092]MCJ2007145.1 GlxA family transcriptional regulator [Methylobacterium sp. J-092]
MPHDPRFQPDAARTHTIRTHAGSPRIVEVLAFPSVQLLDVAGPLQVFATANEQARGSRPYAPRVVGWGDGALTSSAGLRLAVDPLPDRDAPLDTLIVAGGPGVVAASADADLVDWMRARAARARRVASVCTGAFLLGAAGLLDGRRAATHWAHCERLAELYPLARVEPDPIFVQDGPVWSSAGITAGIDLALALVEQDLGRALALGVARHLVMFLKRPGGQAQFSAALALQAGDDRFDALHAWIRENLAGDLSIPALAAVAGMSERSLGRHYRAATGLTPAKGVERLRVEAAQRALSETRRPVKRIAQACGFGSEETMRRSFLRLVAALPQDYRSRFGP